jgi:murein DD-endopeptidase MepM/ murein hydrolase activator NlpD
VKRSYLIRIVPPWGYRVFRLEIMPRHVTLCAALATTFAGVTAGGYYYRLHHAEVRVGELRSLTQSQRERLHSIDAETTELDGELRALEKQDEQIRKMIGADPKEKTRAEFSPETQVHKPSSSLDFHSVAQRVAHLRADSLRLRSEGTNLRTIALHILNMRQVADLARARILAAIPSLNPTGDGGVASGFGWRWTPWPEFHEGLDLEANYGDPVRAAAAGTVVSAGWDGGYGIKVDIDHGNGYHTWYAHLSAVDVHPGQYVRKAEVIAQVGSTGASTGPHLHYQIMLDGKPINPLPYLNGVPPGVLASLK